MISPVETPTQWRIRQCRERYAEFVFRMKQRTTWAEDPCMGRDDAARERWIDQRYAYLDEAYKRERRDHD